ncbi:MAG: histidine--tRNA ligase [Propionibacteriaceae bacterium]|jgi:histidyl-tRNA synthetase|nr:histidine--tRNA ligase [Propionibacteriaceae bacterium]
MSRLAPISGFPEYLPAQRAVEKRVLAILESTFELHGFASVETRAVEPISQLARKGEIDKEIYLVRRLHGDHGAEVAGDDLGLHFDLTVPFARYVVENAGRLLFPFRRYQIQKAWRGERPQEGRYREFTQADIDIVGHSALAPHHDTEVALVMVEALERLHRDLGLPPILMHANHRALVQGFYSGIGVADTLAAVQAVDKIAKIGPDGVTAMLTAQGLDEGQIAQILALASVESDGAGLAEAIGRLGIDNDDLTRGVAELTGLVEAVAAEFPGRITPDLRISRGLDYYTGAVFEIELTGMAGFPMVAGGGRYDALATDGKTTYPGVGLSFGVTRTLAPLLGRGLYTTSRPVPSAVLVAVTSEETRSQADAAASALRRRGIACEVAPAADKFGKQIKFADRRGIPFVWFIGEDGEQTVKDIRTGEQVAADPAAWEPPEVDRTVQVIRADERK